MGWNPFRKSKEKNRDYYLDLCSKEPTILQLDRVEQCKTRINNNYSHPEQEKNGANLCHKAANVDNCLRTVFNNYLQEISRQKIITQTAEKNSIMNAGRRTRRRKHRGQKPRRRTRYRKYR